MKVGDKVIRGIGYSAIVCRVKRVTASVVFLESGERFRRADGRSKLHPCNDHAGIYEAKPDVVANIEYRAYRSQVVLLWAHNYHYLTHDQLQRIAAIINEPKEN